MYINDSLTKQIWRVMNFLHIFEPESSEDYEKLIEVICYLQIKFII